MRNDRRKGAINLVDMERRAQRTLPKAVWDYYAGGAGDEETLRLNQAAFRRMLLHPKVLAGAVGPSLEAEVIGERVSLPVLMAPTAFQSLAYPEAEIAAARAAQALGTVMILSMLTSTPLEEVVKVSKRLWFQLYLLRDRGRTVALLDHLAFHQIGVLVLTVDAPILGHRERDLRNRFDLSDFPGHVLAELLGWNRKSTAMASCFSDLFSASLSWKDVEWLRSRWKGRLVLKGIMRVSDARRALDCGADGIVVSNHGGRQLDTTPASIDALGPVATAVKGRTTIMVDGGVRRGIDVLKALACGAEAVLIGRPVLWGLATSGMQGVLDVFTMLRRELENAMVLCGCRSIRKVTHDLLAPEQESVRTAT